MNSYLQLRNEPMTSSDWETPLCIYGNQKCTPNTSSTKLFTWIYTYWFNSFCGYCNERAKAYALKQKYPNNNLNLLIEICKDGKRNVLKLIREKVKQCQITRRFVINIRPLSPALPLVSSIDSSWSITRSPNLGFMSLRDNFDFHWALIQGPLLPRRNVKSDFVILPHFEMLRNGDDCRDQSIRGCHIHAMTQQTFLGNISKIYCLKYIFSVITISRKLL